MWDKKIIIVTPWFGRFAGGAELLARGMAGELNKRGLSTTVFTDGFYDLLFVAL